jgi:hypothetical protein
LAAFLLHHIWDHQNVAAYGSFDFADGDFLLRSEFDQHPLWETTKRIAETAALIRAEHETVEFPKLETVLFYTSHAETFREVATTSSALFSREMLDSVNVPFTAAASSLQTRLANGAAHTAYVDTAAVQAEASLISMGPWPRPYGKGGQVLQMNTLFENLLESQRLSMEALGDLHSKLREDVVGLESDVTSRQADLEASLVQIQAEGQSVIDMVTAEKARIDQVVANGLKAVAAIETANTEQYKAWQGDQEAKFKSDFARPQAEIEKLLAESEAVFEKLRRTNEQFENLSAIAAGETIANNFQREASWGRTTGIVLYSVGGVFLIAAAVPLIWLLFEGGLDVSGSPQWGLLTVRLAIAILAGSAATVIIRLGARLISDANASKRMELELRSIGPFLANVVDPTDVDSARIALITRSFGQGHSGSPADRNEDSVPVTSIAQVFELVLKAMK